MSEVRDPWIVLADELALTTQASRGLAEQWVELGKERGWTVDETRERAGDCIVGGIHPAALRRHLRFQRRRRVETAETVRQNADGSWSVTMPDGWTAEDAWNVISRTDDPAAES